MDSYRPDDIDLKILDLLQRDGSLTFREIATRLHKTHHTIGERVKKLKSNGYLNIVGHVDIERLKHVFIAFTMIQLKNHSEETFVSFQQHIAAHPQIMECHHLMGQYDFLIKIVLPDSRTYNEFLRKNISTLDYVLRVESFPMLAEIKMQTAYELK